LPLNEAILGDDATASNSYLFGRPVTAARTESAGPLSCHKCWPGSVSVRRAVVPARSAPPTTPAPSPQHRVLESGDKAQWFWILLQRQLLWSPPKDSLTVHRRQHEQRAGFRLPLATPGLANRLGRETRRALSVPVEGGSDNLLNFWPLLRGRHASPSSSACLATLLPHSSRA
jgi:hypothetical protein